MHLSPAAPNPAKALAPDGFPALPPAHAAPTPFDPRTLPPIPIPEDPDEVPDDPSRPVFLSPPITRQAFPHRTGPRPPQMPLVISDEPEIDDGGLTPPHLIERFGQRTPRRLHPAPGLRHYSADQCRWAILQLYSGRALAVARAIERDPTQPVSITDLKAIRQSLDRFWGTDDSRDLYEEKLIRGLAIRVHYLLHSQTHDPDFEFTRLDNRCINLLETLTVARDERIQTRIIPIPGDLRRETRRRERQMLAEAERNLARGKFTDMELEHIDVTPYEEPLPPPPPGARRLVIAKEYLTPDYKRAVIRDAIKAGRYFPPPMPSVAV